MKTVFKYVNLLLYYLSLLSDLVYLNFDVLETVKLFYNCYHLLCLRVRLKQAIPQPQSAGCPEQCHTGQQTQLSS